jgi:hypothetical protein
LKREGAQKENGAVTNSDKIIKMQTAANAAPEKK